MHGPLHDATPPPSHGSRSRSIEDELAWEDDHGLLGNGRRDSIKSHTSVTSHGSEVLVNLSFDGGPRPKGVVTVATPAKMNLSMDNHAEPRLSITSPTNARFLDTPPANTPPGTAVDSHVLSPSRLRQQESGWSYSTGTCTDVDAGDAPAVTAIGAPFQLEGAIQGPSLVAHTATSAANAQMAPGSGLSKKATTDYSMHDPEAPADFDSKDFVACDNDPEDALADLGSTAPTCSQHAPTQDADSEPLPALHVGAVAGVDEDETDVSDYGGGLSQADTLSEAASSHADLEFKQLGGTDGSHETDQP